MADQSEKRRIWRIQKLADKNAANELVTYYYDEIYAFVVRQTLDKELSMDLTQDIFISALRSIGAFDGRKSAFRTWLYKIAANKTVDYFRSRYYKHAALLVNIDDAELCDDSCIEGMIESRDLAQPALQIVSSFEYTAQQIVRLKIFSQLKFSEISEILSLPENTVKTKYYTALKILRKELAGYED